MRLFFVVILFSFLCLTSNARTVEYDDTFSIKGEKLTIDLDVDGGEIEVKRSNHKHDCIVSMEYPKDRCDAEVKYNESRGQLDITIDTEKWDFNDDGHKAPELVLELPYGPEISLIAHIKAGETSFEFGDLNLIEFQLKHWAGETKVNFSEPNRTNMQTFDINVKVGEVDLLNLGNALFEEAEINSGIGELKIDFNGIGAKKSMARIDLDIGETTIIVPDNIGTKLRVSKFLFLSDVEYPNWFDKRGKYYYSENYDDSEKSLYLMISTGIGELNIKVR